MNGVEYVREFCKNHGIVISTLVRDLGFSNGYLNPKTLKTIPYDRAVKIANYTGCSLEKILGAEVETNPRQFVDFQRVSAGRMIFI